jgi:superkiller protein 3
MPFVFLNLLWVCAVVCVAETTESAWVLQVRSALVRNDLQSAIQDARRGIQQYPGSVALYQLLGGALFRSGASQDARAAFQKAIDLAPQEPLNYFNLARVDLSLNRFDDVVMSLTTFLKSDPRDAEAHVLLGRAYHNLNKTLLGIEQFQAGLAIDDRLPLAHFHLGYALLSLGNSEAALVEFRKEMAISPGFDTPHWMAGDIEVGRGNLKAAEDLYRKAVALNPRVFQPHYGLGRVLSRSFRPTEAETEFQTALQYSPGSVETHYALGRLYQQMGKPHEAQKQFQIVSDLHSQARP